MSWIFCWWAIKRPWLPFCLSFLYRAVQCIFLEVHMLLYFAFSFFFLRLYYEVNLLHFTFAFNLCTKSNEQSGGGKCFAIMLFLKVTESSAVWNYLKMWFSYILPHHVAFLCFMNKVMQKSVASSEIASSVPNILHTFLLFCYHLCNGKRLVYFACINAKLFSNLLLSKTHGIGVLKRVYTKWPLLVKEETALVQMLIKHILCVCLGTCCHENWVCAFQQLSQHKMHLTSVSREPGSH